jgi:sulfoxide reductase catalytic subunit YedY
MLIGHASDIRSSEITGKAQYLNRRGLIMAAGLAGGAALGLPLTLRRARGAALQATPSPLSTTDAPTPKNKAETYNNFYEFGTDKDDPSENAGSLKTSPWSIAVEGECAKPATYTLEDILKGETLEDRVYRHRCVERWSMVIPWAGFPLANLLKRVEPTGNAKYVAFETLYDPKQMPGQRDNVLHWPYTEGLRLDEAMHPLTLLAVGMYGETLPNQDGAPIRLVVPWKYGFKGIKSIVKIRLQADQPKTAWNIANANEYGFYSNVNPDRDHPRWSQRKEHRIDDSRLGTMIDTQIFNGYGDQVASLYAGMDLINKYY